VLPPFRVLNIRPEPFTAHPVSRFRKNIPSCLAELKGADGRLVQVNCALQTSEKSIANRISLARMIVFVQNYQGIQVEYLSKIANFMSGLIDRIAA
jgi:hypothetical protein